MNVLPAMDDVDLTTRDSFRFWTPVTIRFSDQDPLGHVNNVAFAAYIEAARTMLIGGLIDGQAHPGIDFVLASVTIDYRKEIHYPGTVDVGARVLKLGSKSITTGYGVFLDDLCTATSSSVNVFFSVPERRTVEIPADVRAAQVIHIATGAGHQPFHMRQLLGLLPLGRGPDVLGVGRTAPWQSPDLGAVAGHGCRRVQEMGVDPGYVVGQFGGHDQGLAEPTDPIRRQVAKQIAEKCPAGGSVSRPLAHPQPGAHHPDRRLVKVLRQIVDGGGDLSMDGVGLLVGRPAQGHYPVAQTGFL